jgi:hypothetical protein
MTGRNKVSRDWPHSIYFLITTPKSISPVHKLFSNSFNLKSVIKAGKKKITLVLWKGEIFLRAREL